MTIKELVVNYKNRIYASNDRKCETKKILREINELTYSSNKQLIGTEDKKEILEALQQELLRESVVVHAQDNSEYLELINQAISLLGDK